MPDAPKPQLQRTDPAKLAVLRRLIDQRKRFDFLFSAVGLSLIVLSLGVLAALAAKLVYDGGSRLTETHYVTPWGQSPGFLDLVGTLEIENDVATLHQPPLALEAPGSAGDLAALVGKRVSIKGVNADGKVVAEQITAVEPGPIAGKVQAVGVISDVTKVAGDDRQYAAFEPEPLVVKMPTDNEFKTSELDGNVVALKPTSSRAVKVNESRVEAKAVIPLKKQTFFNAYPSNEAGDAGVYPALLGTLLIMVTTAVITLPMGVAAGIYLEEYASKSRMTNLIEINIANLAGVPSVIWGLLGLGLFVQGLGNKWGEGGKPISLGESVITAGLTLGLLVLPVIIIATREAIRAVPNTIREASIGLGATKWQTIRYHVLPYSYGGILTGAIIAMSRAVGETAPLLLVGGLTYLNFTPFSGDAASSGVNPVGWFQSQFSVLPMMTYEWVSRPQNEFHRNAAAGSIVLLAVTLSMNGIAIYLRYRLRRNIKW